MANTMWRESNTLIPGRKNKSGVKLGVKLRANMGVKLGSNGGSNLGSTFLNLSMIANMRWREFNTLLP